MTRRSTPSPIALVALLAANGAAAQSAFVPVTDAMLRDPDPADWLMWRRTADSWGYSPLARIDRRNVARLAVAWSVDLDAAPSQEGIPLVYDGVLYFPGPSDVTTAFEAATGRKLWEHRRNLPADLGQFVPFPQTNRNLAIYDRLVIDNGADDFVYALDAVTGEMVWETKILDYKIHHVKQGSAPPLVANGVLIAGRNCQPNGGPDACIITGHDARTGKELWRKRTIPRPGEPGGDSWGDVPDESTSAPRSRRPRRSSYWPATTSSTSTITRRSRCAPRRARRSGTTSTPWIIGISTIRSSGFSSTPSSRPTRARCRGSTRAFGPASAAVS
jgi:alcohol dehydrogenase (cytochrome c)